MTGMPDELRTARLVLRRVTPADADAAIAIHADPETTRYRPDGAASPEQTRALLDDWIAHWAAHGFGYWAIVLADIGKTIGFGGVRYRHVEGELALNVYYRIARSAWGHGYAPEMVAAAVGWAARDLPGVPVMIITNVDNTQAMKVAEKTGFVEAWQGDCDGVPSRYYRYAVTPPR